MITVTARSSPRSCSGAKRPVLREFTASWCPPCRMIEPVLREIAAEQAGRLVVGSSTWTPTPATARAAGVLGMPTLNLYIDGRVVAQVVGARSKAVVMRTIEEFFPITR